MENSGFGVVSIPNPLRPSRDIPPSELNRDGKPWISSCFHPESSETKPRYTAERAQSGWKTTDFELFPSRVQRGQAETHLQASPCGMESRGLRVVSIPKPKKSGEIPLPSEPLRDGKSRITSRFHPEVQAIKISIVYKLPLGKGGGLLREHWCRPAGSAKAIGSNWQESRAPSDPGRRVET